MNSNDETVSLSFCGRVVLCAAALFAPLGVTAQEPDVCAVQGERVRVHRTEGDAVVGDVVGCSANGLEVRPDDGSGGLSPFIDHVIPLAGVESVEVSGGYKKPVVRPVAIGAATVGAVFGGFAYLTGEDGGTCATGYCVRLSRKRKTVTLSSVVWLRR